MNLTAVSSAHWRKTLHQNQLRTNIIIVLFFLMYSGIGLLIDLFLYSATFPNATFSQLLEALISFQLFPVATIILLVIACASLMISFALYDKLMLLGTTHHEVTSQTTTLKERELYHVVEEMKIAGGLRFMPKVYVIEANYMNAFATGYSEKSALVAITKGLMEKLNREELQAVMAHELSHIRHLDIKVTLAASLLANMTLIVIDLLFRTTLFSERRDNRSRQSLLFAITIIRFILPIMSVLLLLYLSRTREYMADAGSVELMRSNTPLAHALIKIHDDYQMNRDEYRHDYAITPHENVRREAYLFDPVSAGLRSPLFSIGDLFSTHPSIKSRLKAIGFKII